MKWCLDNEFELIDLNPKVDDTVDDEDDGPIEPFERQEDGIVRISQAIQAHTWPYSSLKGLNFLKYYPNLLIGVLL